MNASIAALAYLAAGVLFILSLRGLSSPETSRRGNTFGMVASALAGVIPAIIVGVGFGSALLMLASIDRRLGILEGKE